MSDVAIVIVEKRNSDGSVDGRLLQRCVNGLEDAQRRLAEYDHAGHGTPYALIEIDSGYVPTGWLFPGYRPIGEKLEKRGIMINGLVAQLVRADGS